jgi:hypothetical protein
VNDEIIITFDENATEEEKQQARELIGAGSQGIIQINRRQL